MRNLILAAALSIIAAIAAGGYGYWRGENAGKAALQASLDRQRAQALTEAAKQSAAADAAVARLRQANQTTLADASVHTKETVHYAIRYVQTHPAPADCVLADQLVQRLDADIQRTNAAARRLRRARARRTAAPASRPAHDGCHGDMDGQIDRHPRTRDRSPPGHRRLPGRAAQAGADPLIPAEVKPPRFAA